jgi:hypothetical protein
MLCHVVCCFVLLRIDIWFYHVLCCFMLRNICLCLIFILVIAGLFSTIQSLFCGFMVPAADIPPYWLFLYVSF